MNLYFKIDIIIVKIALNEMDGYFVYLLPQSRYERLSANT
ncbi:Protein of unknown function [Bacillus cytotoxicus]|uniref:Uncharacterized protein n=1 Tax=Bacillus cytotoxicus TaxID=580165 RepID=A0AAX2CDR5_9BACI|nr:Protein of unknown function [Bacillus cytotoxicus]